MTKCQWMQTAIVFPNDSHLYSVISVSDDKVVNNDRLMVFFFYLFYQSLMQVRPYQLCNISLFMREKAKRRLSSSNRCNRVWLICFKTKTIPYFIYFFLFLQGPQGERVSTESKILQLFDSYFAFGKLAYWIDYVYLCTSNFDDSCFPSRVTKDNR